MKDLRSAPFFMPIDGVVDDAISFLQSNSLMLVRVMIIYREEIIKKFLLVMVMTRFLEGSVI